MSELKVVIKSEGDTRFLAFTGNIDENFDFAQLLGNPGKIYKVDFNEVKMINSCGIREWIRFVEKLGTSAEMNYYNCPHIIIQQMNMVAGFLRPTSKVHSFYAPYYCEETDEERHILLNSAQIINFKAPVQTLNVDGQDIELEFDGIEEQFFKFLKRG